MSSSKKNKVPEELKSAYSLFEGEIEKHLNFFSEILSQLEELQAKQTEPEPISPERAEAMERRFHAIRGGASFLGLKDLSTLANHGESLCQNAPSELDLLSSELKGIVSALQENFSSVRKANQ